jgi:hypothetical protein
MATMPKITGKELTERTRQAALSILEFEGWSWSRVGKGQRFVVEMHKGEQTVRALMKVASIGSAITTTDNDDADKAKLIGFGPDVDHVLFAVGNPQTAETEAYLVPIGMAERAYRDTHRAWRARHPGGKPNTAWVLWFTDGGDQDCNRFHRKWAQFRIGSSRPSTGDPVETPLKRPTPPALAEEKARLAARFGVPADRIRIVIEL